MSHPEKPPLTLGVLEPHASVSFTLGIISLVLSVIPIATICGLASSLTALKWSIILLVLFIPPTFIFGITAKNVIQKSNRPLRGAKMAHFGMIASLMTAIYLLLILAAIPSHSRIYYMMQAVKCESDMNHLAKAVTQYIAATNTYPQDLAEVAQKGHIDAIPQCISRDYIYRVEGNNADQRHFIIECPEPERLLKGSGFSKPKKIQQLSYIQGQGLVVQTLN